MRRLRTLGLVLAALLAASTAAANRFDLIVADAIDVTLCQGCGITLAGLDYGLIANTSLSDLTLAELQAARFTATTTTPDLVLTPFLNIPNADLVGAIHPGEVVGSVIDENQLLLAHVRPGETFRNLGGVQFMAFQIERYGPYTGPVDFTVRAALGGEVVTFTIHANATVGPHAIRFRTARRVSSGPGNGEPDCSRAAATPSRLWPPGGEFVPVAITGVTDPEGGPVTVVVDGVTQDEPTDVRRRATTAAGRSPVDDARPGPGHGECADARIVDGRAWLRAERDANGNGRVYQLRFHATDDHAGTCSGTVAVCVPHDGAQSACIDDGSRFDSRECTPEPPDSAAARGRAGALVSNVVVRDGRELRYSLLRDSEIDMELYDVGGRRIAQLEQGRRAAGEHAVPWDGARASGVYFVRVRADGQVQPGPTIRIHR